jgi:hypothetical protein
MEGQACVDVYAIYIAIHIFLKKGSKKDILYDGNIGLFENCWCPYDRVQTTQIVLVIGSAVYLLMMAIKMRGGKCIKETPRDKQS